MASMPQSDTGSSPRSTRELLDDGLRVIEELAGQVEAYAHTLVLDLLGTGGIAASEAAAEPDGYVDRTLLHQSVARDTLKRTDALLLSLSEEFRERLHDVSPARG